MASPMLTPKAASTGRSVVSAKEKAKARSRARALYNRDNPNFLNRINQHLRCKRSYTAYVTEQTLGCKEHTVHEADCPKCSRIARRHRLDREFYNVTLLLPEDRSPAKRSVRKDGRGHWQANKRRSDLSSEDAIRLVRMLSEALASGMSMRAVARVTGISERTLRRWFSGEDKPTKASAEKLQLLTIDSNHQTEHTHER
jgi:DNA-binding transcriptional regulator YiaG